MNAETGDEQGGIGHLEIPPMVRLVCDGVSFSKLRGLLVAVSQAIRPSLGGDGWRTLLGGVRVIHTSGPDVGPSSAGFDQVRRFG